MHSITRHYKSFSENVSHNSCTTLVRKKSVYMLTTSLCFWKQVTICVGIGQTRLRSSFTLHIISHSHSLTHTFSLSHFTFSLTYSFVIYISFYLIDLGLFFLFHLNQKCISHFLFWLQIKLLARNFIHSPSNPFDSHIYYTLLCIMLIVVIFL